MAPTSRPGSSPRDRTSSTRAPKTFSSAVKAARTPSGAGKRLLAVCGPTAAGKSPLADSIAATLSESLGSWVPVAVVDSMQVYSGLEVISNQARQRPAELVSVVPVTERWTVARHARAAEEVISACGPTAVLDAGTGMYLNAILLDIPIAPEVPGEVRRRAQEASAGEENPRRAARELELDFSCAPERGSIWDADLAHEDTTVLYVRPDRDLLDDAIARRSGKIVAGGLPEARRIRGIQDAGRPVNPSVLEAIGVREMLMLSDGLISAEEATDQISTRSRRLARRQMRWFDKLARTLEGRARVVVLPSADDDATLHMMHGIVRG